MTLARGSKRADEAPSTTVNDVDDPRRSSVARPAGRLEAVDCFVAVAMADRPSALLTAKCRPESEKSEGLTERTLIVLHPDLRARN